MVFERIYILIMENMNNIPTNESKIESVVCTLYDLKMVRDWCIKVDIPKAAQQGKNDHEGYLGLSP